MSLTKVRPQQKFPLTINGAGKNKMEYKNRGKRKEDKTAQTLKEIAIREEEQRDVSRIRAWAYYSLDQSFRMCCPRSFALPSKCTERRVGEGKSKLDSRIPDITL